jgi:hypothetical protein
MTGDIKCRGSLVLGTGCCSCEHCFRQLLQLVNELRDESPCRLDHHNKCQTHNLHDVPCPHDIARRICLKFSDYL